MSEIKHKIEQIIAPIAKKYGQELVDVILSSNRKGVLIKVSVGSKEGPTISELTSITKEFNKAASSSPEDFFGGDYQLEVSSPGIDRNLETFNDFYWNEGRDMRLIYRTDDEEKETEGTIMKASESGVTLKCGKDETEIPYKDIVKAKLKIKF